MRRTIGWCLNNKLWFRAVGILYMPVCRDEIASRIHCVKFHDSQETKPPITVWTNSSDMVEPVRIGSFNAVIEEQPAYKKLRELSVRDCFKVEGGSIVYVLVHRDGQEGACSYINKFDSTPEVKVFNLCTSVEKVSPEEYCR